MPPEHRGHDRPVHYTMKTTRQTTHTPSPTYHKTTSPMASSRKPHSVSQSGPPKLSPSAAGRQDTHTSSPNYFGLTVEPAGDRESSAMPHENWSPPTSSVKSFAAAIPKQLPLDANPDFEAFRRQADANRGASGFALGSSHIGRRGSGTPREVLPTSARPKGPPRWHTHGSETSSDAMLARPSNTAMKPPVRDGASVPDSAYVSSDSKRTSDASLHLPSILSMPRHDSPAQMESPFHPRSTLSPVEDRHPRLSITQGRTASPLHDSGSARSARAQTVPTPGPSGPAMLTAEQLRTMLELPDGESLLLLDLRVATQYGMSRVRGALNLCIPTTLLKRATFNLQKLQQTFQSDEDQARFAAWRSTTHLVVYDASSSENRDAVAATNMLRKFTSEGYTGKAYMLRGGFNGFALTCPQLIDHRPASELSSTPSLTLGTDARRRPTIAPVIGGVMLPTTKNKANPFFANIRQNMDLADGVGQMPVIVPKDFDPHGLPRWLREASEPADRGKRVSDRFLRIELDEQTRMRHAYAGFGSAGPASNHQEPIQLSGIEKGSKNRYKDILPFEHARVRLQDKANGACDYVNASHVQASRSRKRYIASQGPLPATFEDFWSVIWDQDVRVIVMLTAESEGGQLKCHPYWTGREFGPVRLRALSEKRVSLDIHKQRSHSNIASQARGSGEAELGRRRANTTTLLEPVAPATPNQPGGALPESPFVIIRKFALSHSAHPFAPMREITHLHYPSWPDFGAPAQPSHLLALVELANVMQRAALPLDVSSGSGSRTLNEPVSMTWHDEPESDTHARPMLVHCSAGCGRTGTFCTVDSVIDMLKRQRLRVVARANATQRPSRDLDGDIAMDDAADEPLSPTATGRRSSRTNIPRAAAPLRPEKGMEWVEDDTMDLIAMTVEDFRRQRLSMVQSLRQFVLCYETVTEWVSRLQERASVGPGVGGGRARSGSLQERRGS